VHRQTGWNLSSVKHEQIFTTTEKQPKLMIQHHSSGGMVYQK